MDIKTSLQRASGGFLLISLTAPLATIHLLRRPHAQPDPAVAEQGVRRSAVDACVEVDVGAVLVRVGCAALRAERVPVGCAMSSSAIRFLLVIGAVLQLFAYQGIDS